MIAFQHMFKLKTMVLPHLGYWEHIWPAEVHHISIAMAQLFGAEVWDQIQDFLEGGSVKKEIVIALVKRSST